MSLLATGILSVVTGFRINNAATSGQYLRGNGTNFVSSAIQAADVPTLNQNTTGSSGSCTGNAATATSADNIDGIAFKNSNSTSSFVVDTQGTNGIGYSTGYTLFGQTDGGVYCSTYSADWQHQINGDFRTGQIAIRGKNSGTWQAWRTVLDSSNYTSYAMPAGASATNSVDVRAPIFYDSNDTGYYCDPNSISRFVSAYFIGGIASGTLSSDYGSAAIEVREYAFGGAQTDSWSYAPRIGFHWAGRVASQIAMGTNGWIQALNNPGNANENFQAANIYATGNVTAYYSDKRLKTIVGKITNAIEKVKSIETFKYVNNEIAKEYGFESQEVQIGVSAQSVEKVLPEIVKHAPFDFKIVDKDVTSKSGEWYKTVQYDKLIPLLIEAIKDQQTQIETLSSEIKELNELKQKLKDNGII